MTETPFYFRNGDHALFGILHEPATPSRRPPFIFCHPFAEEKLWAHRVLVTFARRLAADGYPVLRFDYMGQGDSQGEFRDSSLVTALSDVRSAMAQVRLMTRRSVVNLLGLRFGATLASLAAEQDPDVEHVVLWAPVSDGARYMQEFLRINLTTQMAIFREIRHDREALVAAMSGGETVNVDGYDLGHALYSEAAAVKLSSEPKRHQGRCLIAQIDRQPGGRTAADLQQLASSYGRATVTVAQEEPFWKEILRFYDQAPNLFTATLEWLDTVDASTSH